MFEETKSGVLVPAGMEVERAKTNVPGSSRMVRSFAAAEDTNLTATWTSSPLHINQVLHSQLSVLRARSRAEWCRSDYARHFTRLCKVNIVGYQGIRFQSKSGGDGSGLSREKAKRLEKRFSDWGKYRHCDISEESNWKALINQCVMSCAVDGAGLFRIHTGPRINEYGIALEALDPEVLDVNHFDNLENGNRIIFGIEFDRRMRPRAYHLTSQNMTASRYSHPRDFGKRRVRVPAHNMIHVFDKEFPGQLLGIPWGATPLLNIHQIAGFKEAALAAAQYGAAKMGFITSPDGSQPPGDGWWPNGYPISRVVPGSIETLPAETDFKAFDPGYPNGESGPFIEHSLRGSASGYGVSYESLANDRKGVNFSSIRAGKLEERDVWQERQELIVSQFCDQVADRWLGQQMLVDAAGFSATDFEAMAQYRMQPRGWSWVDPVKDVTSSFEEVKANAKSLSQHMRDAGRDPDDVWREIARDKEQMEAMGIGLGSVYGESEAQSRLAKTKSYEEEEMS